MDRLSLDRAALASADRIVAEVRPEHLAGPTPCGWSVRELLGHMVSHNHGFTLAAQGTPVGAEVWDDMTIDDDVYAAYRASAAEVTAAFTADQLPEKIEVYGYGTFPLPVVLGMHIVDFTVHGWDIARSIGIEPDIDPHLSEAALEIMRTYSQGRPNKAFGVVVDVPGDAPVLDRLVGFLGRDPHWTR